MVSTTEAAEFHTHFQDLKQAILHQLNSPNPTTSEINVSISKLRSTYEHAFQEDKLTAYDERAYDSQLKQLESQLASLRAEEKPKSRFTFSKRGPTEPKPITLQFPESGPSSPSSTHRTRTTPPLQNSTNYTLSSAYDVHLTTKDLSLLPGTTSYTLTLSDLRDCVIDLTLPEEEEEGKGPVLSTLHARNLRNCVVITPMATGSMMFDSLVGCTIDAWCQQFRLHSSSDSTILLQVASTPIIEHCKGIRFGRSTNPKLSLESGDESKYEQVQDFDWVRPGHSPNWSVVSAAEYTEITNNFQQWRDGSIDRKYLLTSLKHKIDV